MNKDDSMLMRAIAEVAFNGYTDEYGNHTSLVARIISQFKPTEDFYKRLEKKISVEDLANRISENIAGISAYDKDKIRDEVLTRAKELAAQQIAEKMVCDVKEQVNK